MTINKKFLALPALVAVFAMASFAGLASAQTVGPRVQIQLASNGLTNPLVASTTGATVARLSLNTTGSSEAVRISSLPFILTTGSGALSSSLENCQVYNEASASSALNTSSASTTLSSGINTISFMNPLIVPANTVVTLALRCDVDPSLVPAGTYTFSMNSANVVASGASTGLPAVVTVPGGVVIVPPVIVPPVVVVPGLPVTGGNGDAAMNFAVLFASALLLSSVGYVYLNRQAKRS